MRRKRITKDMKEILYIDDIVIGDRIYWDNAGDGTILGYVSDENDIVHSVIHDVDDIVYIQWDSISESPNPSRLCIVGGWSPVYVYTNIDNRTKLGKFINDIYVKEKKNGKS